MSKIKKEQLERLQELVGNINNLKLQIGGFEIQKSYVLKQVLDFQDELNIYQKELEDEYGNVLINIQSGEISKEE
jgi:hypothetical protein